MWTSRSVIILLGVLISLAVIDSMPARNRGGGGGGNGGARCKYRKGQWGECNAATSKKIRTDTLITETSGTATCNSTRTFEKACRRKACEYGDWTEYGACENNKQTKTRPILTGDEATCGKKAKKTKSCRGAGRQGGGAGRGGAGGRRRGNDDGAARS